jgi:uncharacterized protein (TIGR03663 family)
MRRPDRASLVVVAVAALALLARLAGLGARPFHWDEARIGYWSLRSLAVGGYEYRPVAGGPFLYIVSRWLFTAVGASDTVARLPVALLGGLLPLSALLFRGQSLTKTGDQEPEASTVAVDAEPTETQTSGDAGTVARSSLGLDAAETVSLALLLAFAPPLLYYSRVFRGDLPLAAFGLLAFSLLHRARFRGNRRALYAAAAAFGLALAASGFALAMLACWPVAAALVFDEGRLRGDSPGVIIERARGAGRTLVAWTVPVLRAAVVTLAVALFFYVPRGVIDLTEPGTLLSALSAGSLGAANRFLAVRVLGRYFPPAHRNGHALLPFVGGTLEVLVATALPVLALGLWGVLRERYGGRSRPAVSFGAYWAGVGLFVFPATAEVNEPWVAVHVLVPLTLPAAVGLGALWRYARRTFAAGDAASVAIALLLLAATGLHAGVLVADEVCADPDAGDDLAGFAQPATELRPAMDAATGAIRDNDGADVLYVGDRFFVANEPTLDGPPVPAPARDAFAARLPLAWYFEQAGAESTSVQSPDAMPASPPPVVVTVPGHAPAVDRQVTDAYRRYRVDLALTGRTVVVFVDG